MPYVLCSDEHGKSWVVSKEDPGWGAAWRAKMKLLLDTPVLPRKLIMTGLPDRDISDAARQMDEYLEAREQAGSEVLTAVWKSVSLRFRAWRTQAALFDADDSQQLDLSLEPPPDADTSFEGKVEETA